MAHHVNAQSAYGSVFKGAFYIDWRSGQGIELLAVVFHFDPDFIGGTLEPDENGMGKTVIKGIGYYICNPFN